ncbi:hypothetical protein FACS189499_10560 [Clostridia bacterium]|nr:hypothetical protein FACS189499_10560 [Clostridia bacterium]
MSNMNENASYDWAEKFSMSIQKQSGYFLLGAVVVCGLGSLTIEISAINSLISGTWLKIFTCALIVGIEVSKTIFPVSNEMYEFKKMDSFSNLGKNAKNAVGQGFNVFTRLLAFALSALSAFIVLSGDITISATNAYNDVYVQEVEIVRKQNNDKREQIDRKISEANKSYDDKRREINTRYNNDESRIREDFDKRVSAFEALDMSEYDNWQRPDVKKQNDDEISELNDKKDKQIEESKKSRKEELDALPPVDIDTLKKDNGYGDILTNEKQIEEKAADNLSKAKKSGYNPSIEATVTLIKELANITIKTETLYDLLCLIISLLISVVAESVIFSFSNTLHWKGKNVNGPPTNAGS